MDSSGLMLCCLEWWHSKENMALLTMLIGGTRVALEAFASSIVKAVLVFCVGCS